MSYYVFRFIYKFVDLQFFAKFLELSESKNFDQRFERDQ